MAEIGGETLSIYYETELDYLHELYKDQAIKLWRAREKLRLIGQQIAKTELKVRKTVVTSKGSDTNNVGL